MTRGNCLLLEDIKGINNGRCELRRTCSVFVCCIIKHFEHVQMVSCWVRPDMPRHRYLVNLAVNVQIRSVKKTFKPWSPRPSIRSTHTIFIRADMVDGKSSTIRFNSLNLYSIFIDSIVAARVTSHNRIAVSIVFSCIPSLPTVRTIVAMVDIDRYSPSSREVVLLF